MTANRTLDPHARPPDAIKDLYKQCQRLKANDLMRNDDILNFESEAFKSDPKIRRIGRIEIHSLQSVFEHFDCKSRLSVRKWLEANCPLSVYEHSDMPGLRIVPNLLPPAIQKTLLSRLIHRDLSNEVHKSNVHLHHEVSYPRDAASFFAVSPSSDFSFPPRDAAMHKPLSVSQFLSKKLRWITLGGQYNWTSKVYPEELPPVFPEDVAKLLLGLFPDMHPEAAIVNFYSPGDTLSLHRDVAEECDQGLISISIGCDGIFILGLTDESHPKGAKTVAIRLRSGDAVYMDGESRFAWHGVPQIISDTCPEWLQDWPAEDGEYEEWKGWMASKRINLNVRQMWEKS